jgi:hypothetical protein
MIARIAIKKLLLLIALPAILWLYFNQAANWHYHMSNKGILIEHAHPYTKSNVPGYPFPNHNHTDLEYSILAQISQVASLLVFALLLTIMIPFVPGSMATLPVTNTLPRHLSDSLCLRGPPVYIHTT